MFMLILGLIVFLGAHSVRIVADDWRSAQIARMGINTWKGVYTLVSLAGFVMIVWGFGQARIDPIVLWHPPLWTRHIAGLLTLIAFVLLAAAYIPANHLKSLIGHPMVAGVKTWAFAHLIANGRLPDAILFGSFLVWAIVDFIASRRRDRLAGTQYPAGTAARDALVAIAGLIAWGAFAFVLHGWLIGVRPFG